MKSQGIENTITRRAADPAAFTKPPKADQMDAPEKRKGVQKIVDFPMAVRIQALALAEASISYDRIRGITGVETKLLDKLRKIARDQGYDPTTSMLIKEDYVADPVNKCQGRPKKQRLDGILHNGGGKPPADRVVPDFGHGNTSVLPPGNWGFMAAAAQAQSGTSLG